jgi:hypothetical protein
MVEFVKKHKIPLILLAVSVGLYLLYDYLQAKNAAAVAATPNPVGGTTAAQQYAYDNALSALQAGATDTGGSSSSPIATSPAVTGTLPTTASTPGSTGTAASSASGTSVNSTTTTPTINPVSPGSGVTGATPASALNSGYGATGPTNLGVPIGADTEAQEQATNAAANLSQGSSTANTDEAIYQGILQGNPQDIAMENQYNAIFTEQDPQVAAMTEKAGENPYLAMLSQGVAGQLTPAEAALNAQFGNQPIYQFPTSESTNPSESSGSTASTAGPGGSTSAIGTSLSLTDPNAPATITGPTGGPSSLTASSGIPNPTRTLTTVPASPKNNIGTSVTSGGVVSTPIITTQLPTKTPQPTGPVGPTGSPLKPIIGGGPTV